MACNCLDIGCYDSCVDCLTTDLTAPATGVYTVVYHYGNAQHKKTFNATQNQPFEVPNIFRETGPAMFTILKPDGAAYETDGIDCFIANMKVSYSIT